MASVVFGVGETSNYVLESVTEVFLFHGGAMSILSFSGVYGISLTFGNLSDEDLIVFLYCLLCVVRHQSWVVQADGRSISYIKNEAFMETVTH